MWILGLKGLSTILKLNQQYPGDIAPLIMAHHCPLQVNSPYILSFNYVVNTCRRHTGEFIN